jgi:N-carbamoylputrescine amidase
MHDLKVAAACMYAEVGEIEQNLDRIRAVVLEASANNADIVCFPELSVTGYTLKRPEDVYRELDQKKVQDCLSQMAREARLIIIAGMIDFSHGLRPFITQVVAGPKGLIGLYRKTHLSAAERDVYRAGEKIEVYTHENTVLGVQLCYEAHFPEISTIMALMGAEVLFLPHASPRGNPDGKLQGWLRHLPARAFDNGLFVVVCNQLGKTREGYSFPGVAMILGPDGRVMATYAGNEQKILYAELKAEMLHNIKANKMKYFLPQRRPELYNQILSTGRLST